LKSEIPFKSFFDRKRDEEYLKKPGFLTHFIIAEKDLNPSALVKR
jgi:hypothetical protein